MDHNKTADSVDINLLMNCSSVASNQNSWERMWKAALESITSKTPSLGMTWQSEPVVQTWHLFFCHPSPSPLFSPCLCFQLPNQKSWLSGQIWSWTSLKSSNWSAPTSQDRTMDRVDSCKAGEIGLNSKYWWVRTPIEGVFNGCMLSILQYIWQHNTRIQRQ